MDKGRPKFFKGFTFRLREGVAIILNDGLYGRNLVEQYKGQTVTRFNSSGMTHMTIDGSTIDIARIVNHIWYNILVGDIKGWITEYRMEMIVHE